MYFERARASTKSVVTSAPSSSESKRPSRIVFDQGKSRKRRKRSVMRLLHTRCGYADRQPRGAASIAERSPPPASSARREFASQHRDAGPLDRCTRPEEGCARCRFVLRRLRFSPRKGAVTVNALSLSLSFFFLLVASQLPITSNWTKFKLNLKSTWVLISVCARIARFGILQ